MRISRPLRLVAPAVLVLTGACTNASPADTTLPPVTTTTTTTIVLSVRSTAESPVSVAPEVGADVADAIVADVDGLRTTVENLRGLGFIGPPRIVVLDRAAFDERRTQFLEAPLDAPALAVESRLYRTLGLLGAGEDLRGLVLRAVSGEVPAFYDTTTRELVVDASSGDLGPGGRSVIVREMTAMLTDQYHDHSGRVAELTADGRYDEALALASLATADALYTQLRYLDGLSSDDRQAAVATFPVSYAPGPEFLADQLAFPSEAALAFVGWALTGGGLPALDAAYGPGLTTEQLLHPSRQAAGEGVLDIDVPEFDVTGYRVVDEGTFGELRLEGLLSASLTPGFQTQVGDGWGADRFALLAAADDIAFVYTFRGDSANDTYEVAQAFLDHATLVMGMAEPVSAAGGAEFVGRAGAEGEPPDGPYVFVDRDGDGLVVVIATTTAAGRLLRDQVSPP